MDRAGVRPRVRRVRRRPEGARRPRPPSATVACGAGGRADGSRARPGATRRVRGAAEGGNASRRDPRGAPANCGFTGGADRTGRHGPRRTGPPADAISAHPPDRGTRPGGRRGRHAPVREAGRSRTAGNRPSGSAAGRARPPPSPRTGARPACGRTGGARRHGRRPDAAREGAPARRCPGTRPRTGHPCRRMRRPSGCTDARRVVKLPIFCASWPQTRIRGSRVGDRPAVRTVGPQGDACVPTR